MCPRLLQNSAIRVYYKTEAGSAELLPLFDAWSCRFRCELRAQLLLYGKARKRGVVPCRGLTHMLSTRRFAWTHGHRNVNLTSQTRWGQCVSGLGESQRKACAVKTLWKVNLLSTVFFVKAMPETTVNTYVDLCTNPPLPLRENLRGSPVDVSMRKSRVL